MAPILDTDLAEERWSKAEWENYELWEKIEQRLRRQRRAWILVCTGFFLVLSAIPIVIDRWPKWRGRAVVRQLALEVNKIKTEAIRDRGIYRLKFIEDGKLNFVVERVLNCETQGGEMVRLVSLVHQKVDTHFRWMSEQEGATLGVPGLAREFCYDSLNGFGDFTKGQQVVAFGIIPDKDLTEGRLDRLSLLLLSGPSAEISFD